MTALAAHLIRAIQTYPETYIIAAAIGIATAFGFVLGCEVILFRWERVHARHEEKFK